MEALASHWRRMLVTLVPVVFALLHATDWLPLGVVQRLDNLLYDARLRATMPGTVDSRIVVVDIDEQSLSEVGHWPWSRDKLARLTDELFVRQQAALVGFDVLFAEADTSSGLDTLQKLAREDLQNHPEFAARVQDLQAQLDFDSLFAQALSGRDAVLGYYFTSDREGRTRGVLPAPVMEDGAMQGASSRVTVWNGYGANIAQLAQAAPQAGFFNSVTDSDGVVRAIPLLAQFDGRYYESLALAMFRRLVGQPSVAPGFVNGAASAGALASIQLRTTDSKTISIPVDDRVTTLVPFRGPGGAQGGSFVYESAADVLAGRLLPAQLAGKIVLVGTTAPGLLDVRATPVGQIYPGVEVHANVLSGLLDGTRLVRPDYAVGFDVLVLVLVGLVLAWVLPLLPAAGAVLLSLGVLAGLVGLNFWLYAGWGLVLPLASALLMVLAAFVLNMSYGYLVESRAKRRLAGLFGTYVPPELVDEMVRRPGSYSMQARNQELTVMFCDMRGFTQMSEHMEPIQLQGLLNGVFSRLTQTISANRGTIDKYMGDCVMAFWGAPVETPEHAHLAVQAALEMAAAVQAMNTANAVNAAPKLAGHTPPPTAISMGIGLHTGVMCVGDMGSDIRRSYTVVGDAVNLGARLEGLSAIYGVSIVASEATRAQAPDFVWQELDTVRVKGKDTAVTIFTPLGRAADITAAQQNALALWAPFLRAYRAQDWDTAEQQLATMLASNVNYFLCGLYSGRIASWRARGFDPAWDGSTHFDTK